MTNGSLVEALMASLADAVYFVDAAGEVSFVNPAAVAVLGMGSRATTWLVIDTGPRGDLQFGAAQGELWTYWATDPPGFQHDG